MYFAVKFYAVDPCKLLEELTRYFFSRDSYIGCSLSMMMKGACCFTVNSLQNCESSVNFIVNVSLVSLCCYSFLARIINGLYLPCASVYIAVQVC